MTPPSGGAPVVHSLAILEPHSTLPTSIGQLLSNSPPCDWGPGPAQGSADFQLIGHTLSIKQLHLG